MLLLLLTSILDSCSTTPPHATPARQVRGIEAEYERLLAENAAMRGRLAAARRRQRPADGEALLVAHKPQKQLLLA